MAKIAKIIGAGLGWAIGGPIGGILGYAFGSLLDSMTSDSATSKIGGDYKRQYNKYRYNTSKEDFEYSLMILSAAVMKADGIHKKSELSYINEFYIDNYGPEKAKRYMAVLEKLLVRDFNVQEVAEQIRYFMQHALRLQILHYLFGLAKADGVIHKAELNEIYRISKYLGIHQRDFESVKAMFYAYSSRGRGQRKSSSSNYKYVSKKTDPYVILEIKKDATDSEVKKAYRRLARKYHPDTVAHLGDKYTAQAQEKFVVIDEAYNMIKESRRMK